MINIQPKITLVNNVPSLLAMTRYNHQWRCLCILYVNKDDELMMAILNSQKVMPIERCSASDYLEGTRQKASDEVLRMLDLERFKSRLGLQYPVRFVHTLSKLRGAEDERNP